METVKNYTSLSRANKRKNKIRWIRWLILVTSIIIFGLVSITGFAYWKFNDIIDKMFEPAPAKETENVVKTTDKEQAQKQKDSFVILLLGEDYREETGSKNTDAIIVSIWNRNTKKVSLLSIPRDTKVRIPGHGYGKINSAYVKGEMDKKREITKNQEPTTSGSQLMMETLSAFLEIPIDYYIKVDFKSFEAIIDEVDGIEIDVERDMYYIDGADGTSINLKKGLQVLNGKEALDYARFRKSSNGNDSNDFERNERHQKIIKAFVDKASSFKGIINVFDMLNILGDHVKTNLTSDDIKKITWEFKNINNTKIQSLKMNSYWESPYVVIDREEMNNLQKQLKEAISKTKLEDQVND